MGGTHSNGTNTITALNSSGVPSAPAANNMVIYAYDQAAGNSCFHTKSEGGHVVKLFTGAALTAIDATATDGTIGTADTIINNLRTTTIAILAKTCM